MEPTVALASLGLFYAKVVELFKYIRTKDWNAAVTLLTVWLAGIVGVFVAAATELTENLMVPQVGIPLGELNGVSLVFLGVILNSVVSWAYDYKKALDRNDSAKQPPLTSLPEGKNT